MKTLKSGIALLQFVALSQIVCGVVLLPGWMHSGDSAIYDPIQDPDLRDRLQRWHDHQVSVASNWLLAFGVVSFCLGVVAAICVNRLGKRNA